MSPTPRRHVRTIPARLGEDTLAELRAKWPGFTVDEAVRAELVTHRHALAEIERLRASGCGIQDRAAGGASV